MQTDGRHEQLAPAAQSKAAKCNLNWSQKLTKKRMKGGMNG